MSSNFEKGLMGAAVVASSLGTVEAQESKTAGVDNSKKIEVNVEQKNKIPGKSISFEDARKMINTKINNITKEEDQKRIEEIRAELGLSDEKLIPEFYRNKYIKYIEHPSYKQRLAKEMYGDQLIDEEKQQNIDSEYNERLNQLKKVSIKIDQNLDASSETDTPEYKYNLNEIKTNTEGVFHEISHSLDTRPDKSTNDRGFVMKTREYMPSTNSKLIQKIGKLKLEKSSISEEEIDKLEHKLYYLKNKSEIKARLNYLRMKAIKNYNFDLNNDFNIDDFKELKYDPQYKDLKDGLGLSDEQINELMKYTAENIPDENINDNEKEKYV